MIIVPKHSNSIELVGSVSLVLVNTETNTVRQELYYPNLVVTSGKSYIASRMVGTSSSVMSHMGIGLNSTSPVEANLTLTQELSTPTYVNYSRAALTTNTATNNIVTYVATFPANNPQTEAVLREAGIFNASSAGTMLCRTTFPIVTKQATDALTITWTITIQ